MLPLLAILEPNMKVRQGCLSRHQGYLRNSMRHKFLLTLEQQRKGLGQYIVRLKTKDLPLSVVLPTRSSSIYGPSVDLTAYNSKIFSGRTCSCAYATQRIVDMPSVTMGLGVSSLHCPKEVRRKDRRADRENELRSIGRLNWTYDEAESVPDILPNIPREESYP